MVKDTEGELGEAIAGILLGILGGIALGAILEYLFGEKCPNCKKPIKNIECKIEKKTSRI